MAHLKPPAIVQPFNLMVDGPEMMRGFECPNGVHHNPEMQWNTRYCVRVAVMTVCDSAPAVSDSRGPYASIDPRPAEFMPIVRKPPPSISMQFI